LKRVGSGALTLAILGGLCAQSGKDAWVGHKVSSTHQTLEEISFLLDMDALPVGTSKLSKYNERDILRTNFLYEFEFHEHIFRNMFLLKRLFIESDMEFSDEKINIGLSEKNRLNNLLNNRDLNVLLDKDDYASKEGRTDVFNFYFAHYKSEINYIVNLIKDLDYDDFIDIESELEKKDYLFSSKNTKNYVESGINYLETLEIISSRYDSKTIISDMGEFEDLKGCSSLGPEYSIMSGLRFDLCSSFVTNNEFISDINKSKDYLAKLDVENETKKKEKELQHEFKKDLALNRRGRFA